MTRPGLLPGRIPQAAGMCTTVPQQEVSMRPLTNLATLTIALGLVLGCSDAPVATSPEQADDAIMQLPGYALSANGGATADPDCLPIGDVIYTVPLPVSQTEVWMTDVRLKEVQCLTRPDGSRLFHVTQEVVGDLPMPKGAIKISGLGEAGNPNVYDVMVDGELWFTGSFACFWVEPPFTETYDWEFRLTPAGVSKAFCSFPAPSAD